MNFPRQTSSGVNLAEDASQTVINACITMTVLTTVFLALRFYSKLCIMHRGWDWSDTLLAATYICHEGLCVLTIVMIKIGGVGRHAEWVMMNDPSQLVNVAKGIVAFGFIHATGITLPKVFILLFQLRIFSWRGRMLWALFMVLGLVLTTWLGTIITQSVQCIPMSILWTTPDPEIKKRICIDLESFSRAHAISTPVLDLLVIILPIPTICNQQMATIKKIQVILLFCVGSFGIVAAIVRVTAFWGTPLSLDPTWAVSDLMSWSIVETGTYTIAVCLPELRPWSSQCLGSKPGSDVRELSTSPKRTGQTSSSEKTGTSSISYIDMERPRQSRLRSVDVEAIGGRLWPIYEEDTASLDSSR